MANKNRRCTQCKKYSERIKGILCPTGWFCSIQHARDYARATQNKQRQQQINKLKQSQVKANKAAKKAHREAKERLKTTGDYIKEAQAAVNKYIRMRDYGKSCISCSNISQQKRGGTMEAGHFRSRGSAGHLRFNLINIWLQCSRCNRYLSGNIVDYRIELVKRIGIDRVELLECDNKPKKFTIDYLKRVKKIFNKRARFYAKLRGIK